MKNFMRFLAAALLLCGAWSCEYDDSDLWDKVNELEEQVNANSETIATLKALVDALNEGKVIMAVTQTEEGYTLTFSDGSSVSIKNGANGKDGQDGTNGKDGQDGQNGADGKDGKDGDSYFQSVVVTPTTVVITLSDGTVIELPRVVLEANTYSINGAVGELKSVALMMVDEYISIAATPTEGITSAEAIFECEEFLFASVSPLLLNKEIDLMTETELYTVMSTFADAYLESVAPEMTEEIKAGKATFTYADNTLTVKADLTLADGTLFSFHAVAEEQVVVNTNTMTRGDEEKPVRAAFYMAEDGMTALYFTPAEISYFEELYDTTWFVYLMVTDDLVGKKTDITTVGEESLFMFGLSDQMDENNFIEIANYDLQGATGDFTITKNADGNYKAEINLTIDGKSYTVNYEGACTPYDAVPVVKTNYLVVGEEEFTVSAATLTKGTTVWSVELTTSSGKNLVFTAPESCFDGETYGFSQSADMTVTYDGVTYSKANGHNGTLTAYYKTLSQQLTVDFTNYGGGDSGYTKIEFNYSGAVTEL